MLSGIHLWVSIYSAEHPFNTEPCRSPLGDIVIRNERAEDKDQIF